MTAISALVRQVNRAKKRLAAGQLALRLLRAFFLAFLMFVLWSYLNPEGLREAMLLGLLTLATLLASELALRRQRKVDGDRFLFLLEIRYPHARFPAAKLGEEGAAEAERSWQPHAEELGRELVGHERKRLWGLAASLAQVAAILIATFALPTISFETALSNAARGVQSLRERAYLTVRSGHAEAEAPEGEVELKTSSRPEIKLLAPNLVEIRVQQDRPEPPQVILRDPEDDGETLQTFQLFRAPGKSEYSIAFAVAESAHLLIPSIGGGTPLAQLDVAQLPIPKVKLTWTGPQSDPWPDDRPLPLKIESRGKNPLKVVQLVIAAGGKAAREVIHTISGDDTFKLSTDYSLILEPFMDQDMMELEVVAEVIDNALPTPQVGRSRPIQVRVASAYGRYRRALNTLRGVKGHLDEALAERRHQLGEEAGELMTEAAEQSQDTPYFDGLDRSQLFTLKEGVNRATQVEDVDRIYALADALDAFLMEHEILDDRERDRDFFVAARGMSRLLEREDEDRAVAVPVVAERIGRFLDERAARWKVRVDRLQHPERLDTEPLDKRVFRRAFRRIGKDPENGLKVLSKAVSDYRSWIDRLEAAEDEERTEREQKRQQGLASAREELRALQKRQGEVSAALDRAGTRTESSLADSWPMARARQNSNVRGGQKLEAKLRSLAPQASVRMRGAIKAMEQTLGQGDSQEFVSAESYSDLAGRLLRQASRASQKSQSQQGRKRRRRRVTGDNYYGRNVHGGDVEIDRTYRVDPRYRERILDEVQNRAYDRRDQKMLDRYLRRVLR